jgi:hypothetical protein
MNSRGFELAISTLVIIALGVILLIGLVYVVTDGFKKFNNATDPFADSAEAAAVKQACDLACTSKNMFAYCCNNVTLGKETTTCADSRLEVNCELSCAAYSCLR